MGYYLGRTEKPEFGGIDWKLIGKVTLFVIVILINTKKKKS